MRKARAPAVLTWRIVESVRCTVDQTRTGVRPCIANTAHPAGGRGRIRFVVYTSCRCSLGSTALNYLRATGRKRCSIIQSRLRIRLLLEVPVRPQWRLEDRMRPLDLESSATRAAPNSTQTLTCFGRRTRLTGDFHGCSLLVACVRDAAAGDPSALFLASIVPPQKMLVCGCDSSGRSALGLGLPLIVGRKHTGRGPGNGASRPRPLFARVSLGVRPKTTSGIAVARSGFCVTFQRRTLAGGPLRGDHLEGARPVVVWSCFLIAHAGSRRAAGLALTFRPDHGATCAAIQTTPALCPVYPITGLLRGLAELAPATRLGPRCAVEPGTA